MEKRMKKNIILLATMLSVSCFADTISYTMDATGLPVIQLDGKPVLTGKYIGWGENWAWANCQIKHSEKQNAYIIHIDKLKTTGTLNWTFATPNTPEATFVYTAKEDLSPVIGTGIEFNLSLKDAALTGKTTDPVISGKTITWEIVPGKKVEIKFSQNVDSIFFERGNKNTIRVMFFAEKISAGQRDITMQLSLPEATQKLRTLAERYGSPDTTTLNKNAMLPNDAFVDLSFLNHKPAGKYGFVEAKDSELQINGRPLRFWGCNVQAYSLFVTDKELIKKQAKRIAALGYNLVRLHHHDSKRWVKKCLIADGETSQEIDKEALDSYFYWIKCLKDEGIYIWVDLHVGRPFKPGDNIPGFDEIKTGSNGAKEMKIYCYVNERVKELMKKFQEKLITTVNPYTRKNMVNEPAIMGFLITNENDLTHHGGNGLLADKNVPAHHKKFAEKLKAFASKTGLEESSLMKTWEPGDSKYLLNDIEYQWSKEMVEHVQSLGVKVPIASGHMWGGNPTFSLPALTAGTIMDAHCYDNGEFLKRDPRNSATMGENLLVAQLCDFPLAITEWNAEDGAHSTDTFTHQLYIASLSAFQDWDAPMLYGYSQDGLNNRGLSNWSSYNVPAIMGLNPAAALIYRRGDVASAKQQYVIQYSDENLIHEVHRTSPALRTLSMLHGVSSALPKIAVLPWLKPSKIPAGATVVTDINKSFIPKGQNYVVSDTGELYRNWERGIFVINTARSKGFTGWTEGKPIIAGGASFDIDNPKVAVIISSLDGKPTNKSNKMLLTAIGRNVRIKNDTMSEPITGKVSFKSMISGLKITPVNGDGSLQEPIALKYSNGTYSFDIPTDKGTHWFIIGK
jgi:hypothetical protein